MSASKGRQTRKKIGSNGNKRRELVDAAIHSAAVSLFYNKGYSKTGLQDIADAVELSRPALYHYINSKEEILDHLVEDFTISKSHELVQLSGNTKLSPREKLTQLVSSVARQVVEQPLHFRILDRCEPHLSADVKARQLAAKRVVRDAFVETLRQGVATGDFECENIDRAAFALIGMCTWIAWWFPATKGGEQEQTISEITKMALRSVSTPGLTPANPGDTHEAISRIRDNLDDLERALRSGQPGTKK